VICLPFFAAATGALEVVDPVLGVAGFVGEAEVDDV